MSLSRMVTAPLALVIPEAPHAQPRPTDPGLDPPTQNVAHAREDQALWG